MSEGKVDASEYPCASPETVRVYYFEPQADDSTKVHHLRISQDGDFLDPWPRGFFEERYEDILVNDWYSVDPRVFATSKELKFFLESFGHHTGRYMLTLPLSWQEIVRDHLSDARPIESQRIREILAIGMKRGAIWKHPKVPKKFTAEKWIGQAAEFYGVAPELIEAFVADDFDLGGDSTPENMPAVSYSDFDVSSNRSEEISTHPAEYLRVAETLLLASQEVVFVDPYLNPSDENGLQS